MESLATVLRRVPLFADLPPGSFAKIIADLREDVVAPGTTICAEGDPPGDFYVIRSGEVAVYVNHPGGPPELVDTMGANHWFGEAALFTERRRAATVVARSEVVLWRVPKDKFGALIEENPSLILHFTGVVMDRLHAENRQISRLIQAGRQQAEGILARESPRQLALLRLASIVDDVDAEILREIAGDRTHGDLAGFTDDALAALTLDLRTRQDLAEEQDGRLTLREPVRDCLRAQLLQERGEESLHQLHRRAAAAFLSRSRFADAIDHAVDATDFALAAQLIERHWQVVASGGGGARFERWWSRLPSDSASAAFAAVRSEVDSIADRKRAAEAAEVQASREGASDETSEAATGGIARGVGLALAVVLGGGIWLAPPLDGLSVEGQRMLAILGAAVVSWAFDVVPDYVVGLGMMLAWITLEIVPPEVALSGFTSSPFFLINGVLGIAAGLSGSGLLFRMTLHIMRRFPLTHRGQMTGLALSGTAITSCVPDVTSGVAIAAPITLALSDSLGFSRRSKGSASIAMAAMLGFGQMSPFFLTGAAENLLARGMLPASLQAGVTWGTWFVAALPLALVTFFAGFLATLFLYPSAAPPSISRAMLDAQIEALGRISRAEIVNGMVLSGAVLGWLTATFHGIDVAWVAMAGLAVLLAANMLDRAAFRASIYWDFLFYLGAVLSLTGVVKHLGIDRWLILKVEPLISPMVARPASFLLILTVAIFGARFVLPSFPLVSLLTLTVVPIATQAGIQPLPLLLVISTAVSVWFLPYQSAAYLALYFGTKEQAFTHRQARPMAWAYGAIYLIAIAAGIPCWRAMGLIP